MIFDCDGVLVDSEPVANALMTTRLQQEGLNWSEEEVSRRFTGRSMRSCVTEIEEALGHTLDPDWVEGLQVDTFAAFRKELQAVAGVQQVIDAVGLRGWSDCVASSGEHEKMNLTLALTGLSEHFASRLFSSTDVPRGKPAPDLFPACSLVDGF